MGYSPLNMPTKVIIVPKIEIDFPFACTGAESGADLLWYFLVAAALVLWAYPSGPTRLGS